MRTWANALPRFLLTVWWLGFDIWGRTGDEGVTRRNQNRGSERKQLSSSVERKKKRRGKKSPYDNQPSPVIVYYLITASCLLLGYATHAASHTVALLIQTVPSHFYPTQFNWKQSKTEPSVKLGVEEKWLLAQVRWDLIGAEKKWRFLLFCCLAAKSPVQEMLMLCCAECCSSDVGRLLGRQVGFAAGDCCKPKFTVFLPTRRS